ncbi:response regulator [Brenneria goodwinii]|uniref:response regulator n=1 Tax=Brenneria goodwinii TaxID=1109412 RepID=UPI0036E16C68
MKKTNLQSDKTILVASDNLQDAEMVQKILLLEFDSVVVNADPDRFVENFDDEPASVIVLTFDTLSKAQNYCLDLYRQSRSIHLQPHRTILLCRKEEVNEAYKLCRRDLFDDYLLFWPMNYDGKRLPMSVHLALRELDALRSSGPSAAEFAAQARQLSELENVLQQQISHGDACMRATDQAVLNTQEQLGRAWNDFSRRLAAGELPLVDEATASAQLEAELQRLHREGFQQPLQALAQSVTPLTQWANDFRSAMAPSLASSSALAAMAERIRPLVLAVDDDDMHGKLIGAMLPPDKYRLVSANNGMEALSLLRKIKPDVILMDMLMPSMNGLETIRHIQAMPHMKDTPIIMITGKGIRDLVIESLKAGAADFVVKPVERDALQGKISRVLRKESSPA